MRSRLILALAALLAFGLTGVASAQQPTGELVFAHAIAGAPAVDVYATDADGNVLPLFEAVAPEEVTDPEALDTGDYTVSVNLTGTAQQLGAADVSIVAGGLALVTAEPDAAGTPSLAVEYENPATEGILSFANLSGAGVDVSVVVEGTEEPQPLFDGVNNDEAAEGAVPVGTHVLSVNAAGTGTQLASVEFTVNEGLITIVSLRAGNALTVQELDQAGVSYTVLRHGYPEGPAVDVYVLPEGTSEFVLAVANLSPGEESEPVALPAGSHRVVAVDVGGDPSEDVLADATFTFVADSVQYLTFTDELFAAPTPTPTSTATPTATPSASPSAIRTPSRIDTGLGGTADGDQGALVLAGLAGLVTLIGTGALVLRGRRTG